MVSLVSAAPLERWPLSQPRLELKVEWGSAASASAGGVRVRPIFSNVGAVRGHARAIAVRTKCFGE